MATTVGSKVKEAGDAAKSFLDNEVASLAKGDFSLPKEVYRKHASVASDALYGLFDVSMQQFDNLLVARLNRLETNLYLVFGGTGVALLVVLYLFVGMLLSVLRSLKSIEQGAERLAQGDVSKPVDSYSSDELRNVGGAVNSVAQTCKSSPRRRSPWPAPIMTMAASARKCAPRVPWRLWRHGPQPERDGEGPYRGSDPVYGADGRIRWR